MGTLDMRAKAPVVRTKHPYVGKDAQASGMERLPAFADVALRFRFLVAARQQVLPNWLRRR
jgi:hypothetical protein